MRASLLDDVLARIPTSGAIADAELKALAVLYDEHTVYLTLEAALSKQHVIAITAKTSGRCCYEFAFAGAVHLCFLEPDFCTCAESVDWLLEEPAKRGLVCKHLFAVKLAVKAGTTCPERVNDQEFAARVTASISGASE